MAKPSISALIAEYLQAEDDAFVAEVKADYLKANAAAKALHIRVLKQEQALKAV